MICMHVYSSCNAIMQVCFIENCGNTVTDTDLCFWEYISVDKRCNLTSFHPLPIFNQNIRGEKWNFGCVRILCKSPISFIIDTVIRWKYNWVVLNLSKPINQPTQKLKSVLTDLPFIQSIKQSNSLKVIYLRNFSMEYAIISCLFQ